MKERSTELSMVFDTRFRISMHIEVKHVVIMLGRAIALELPIINDIGLLHS